MEAGAVEECGRSVGVGGDPTELLLSPQVSGDSHDGVTGARAVPSHRITVCRHTFGLCE